jgi:chromate transporter
MNFPLAPRRPGKSAPAAAAQVRETMPPVSLAALFVAFLTVSMCGFGGGIVWARLITVDKRRWLSVEEFADIVSLCQFMPGPNIVGIAVCVGAKMRGAAGTIAAICGFLVIPWAIGLMLGLLYLRYAHLTVLRNILGGVAATGAGLLIATGLRLLSAHRRRPGAMVFAALAFALMVFSRLPLLVILFSLVPLSIAVAGAETARAR